jgi:hypothetical protein
MSDSSEKDFSSMKIHSVAGHLPVDYHLPENRWKTINKKGKDKHFRTYCLLTIKE